MQNEFIALTGHTALAWQARLYTEYLSRGELPAAVDVPTGLGKTAVMALWLIARGLGQPLPRRLVYVVDRRAVVDQATTFAEGLRDKLESHAEQLHHLRQGLGLGSDQQLPISTLRGQHADNRRWLEDPSACAIIVGTVDMVGSRLLFEGYGVSRKMRPYHAGLLGTDTLVMLDEAHLVPPFERLLDSVERDHRLGPRSQADRALLPPFRLLSLSATGRERDGHTFRLSAADVDGDEITARRLSARKELHIDAPDTSTAPLERRLADAAWKLRNAGGHPTRCLVFCNQRETALKVEKALSSEAKTEEAQVELFVGARRGLEREHAARKLRALGFLAGSDTAPASPVFLVATSAAEVGVDLDADHMVCDLVAWERMVQRLGRVNRRGRSGDGGAQVHLVVERDLSLVQRAVMRLFQEQLPRIGDTVDVSPGALRDLAERAAADTALRESLAIATTAPPLRPPLTRPLLEAWSMTSLPEHAGRPEVGPWLRGWEEDDGPQTRVAWRKYLPVRGDGSYDPRDVSSYFEAAPPHATELLETETHRVVDWVTKRSRRALKLDGAPVRACVLNAAGEHLAIRTAPELAAQKKEWLHRDLAGATLVVDARMAGLRDGSLDDKHDEPPQTLDDGEPWPTQELADTGAVPLRVRCLEEAEPDSDPGWLRRFRFVIEKTDEGPTKWLDVWKWRHEGANEDDRSLAHRPQHLEQHQSWAQEEAMELGKRLELPDDFCRALEIAARLHDEGKRAERWQRAFRAPPDWKSTPYAKTDGPVDLQQLDGYRHEFGSLPYAENDPELKALPADLQTLVLHLIASHHGHARPTIPTRSCDDAPPSVLQERARTVCMRFVELQARWGPWGLAYWEALLRAADQRASRRNEDARDSGEKS